MRMRKDKAGPEPSAQRETEHIVIVKDQNDLHRKIRPLHKTVENMLTNRHWTTCEKYF